MIQENGEKPISTKNELEFLDEEDILKDLKIIERINPFNKIVEIQIFHYIFLILGSILILYYLLYLDTSPSIEVNGIEQKSLEWMWITGMILNFIAFLMLFSQPSDLFFEINKLKEKINEFLGNLDFRDERENIFLEYSQEARNLIDRMDIHHLEYRMEEMKDVSEIINMNLKFNEIMQNAEKLMKENQLEQANRSLWNARYFLENNPNKIITRNIEYFNNLTNSMQDRIDKIL